MKGKLIFIIPTILILTLCVLTITMYSANKDEITDGKFVYVMNEDGSSYSVGANRKNCDYGAELLIPSSFRGKPVTGISSKGFSGLGFKKLVVPDSLKTIGYEAFKNCGELESVSFARSTVLDSIGNAAFYNCDSLKELNLPSGLKRIPYDMCYDSNGLERVTFASDIELISDGAFGYCVSLKEIILPDSVKTIGENVFYCCHSLESVEFVCDGKLKEIGRCAFYGCTALTDVNFPENIKYIGMGAFSYCERLESVRFTGSKLKSIGASAFIGCNSLSSVDVTDLANWCGVSFVGNDYSNPLYLAQTLKHNGNLVLRLEIPSGVTSIGARAFKNATRIVSVTLPSGFGFNDGAIGEDAFKYCYKLAEIHNFSKLQLTSTQSGLISTGHISAYAQKIYYWKSDDYKNGTSYPYGEPGAIYSKEELEKKENNYVTNIYTYGENDEFIFYKSSTEHFLLGYLGDEKDIVLPETNESYGIFTGAFFGQRGIESVVVPDCVTEIWHYAFYSTSDLKRIYVSDSVISMGDRVFGKTENLEVYFETKEDHLLGWKITWNGATINLKENYSVRKEDLPWVMKLTEK